MRSAWTTRTLGDVADISAGNSAPQDPSHFIDGTVPFFRTADAGRVRFGDISASSDYLNEHGTASLRRYKKGTILFPKSGASTFLNHRVMLGVDGCVSSHLATIVADDKQVLPRFLLYYLSTIDARDLVQDHAYPSLNLPTIAGIEISIPTLIEQQRIVAILDQAFSGIATARSNAEKNLHNARSLFDSHLHFVCTRRTPRWTEMSVGELVADGILAKLFDGNHGEIHPKKSDYTGSGVPFIMARDLTNGLVDTEHCIFVPRQLADSLRVGFAKDGDVLISHKGTIGRSALVNTDLDYIMLTPQVTGYRITDPRTLFNRFLRYYFMSPEFQRDMIDGAADGSTRAYIGITKQLALRLRFPPLADQKRIAEELDDLDLAIQRLTTSYERKLAALDTLRTSFLRHAFSGLLTEAA